MHACFRARVEWGIGGLKQKRRRLMEHFDSTRHMYVPLFILRTFIEACPSFHFNISMTSSHCNDALLEKLSLLVHVLRSFKVSSSRSLKVSSTKVEDGQSCMSKPWKQQVVWFVSYHDYTFQSVCCTRLQGKTNEWNWQLAKNPSLAMVSLLVVGAKWKLPQNTYFLLPHLLHCLRCHCGLVTTHKYRSKI